MLLNNYKHSLWVTRLTYCSVCNIIFRAVGSQACTYIVTPDISISSVHSCGNVTRAPLLFPNALKHMLKLFLI